MLNSSSRYLAIAAFLIMTLCRLPAFAEATPAVVPLLNHAGPHASGLATSTQAPGRGASNVVAPDGAAPPPADCPDATGQFCPADDEDLSPKESKAEVNPGEAGGKEWPWRRAGAAEYLAISAAAAGTIYVEIKNGRQAEAHWTARNGFDEGIRDAVRLESRDARDAADMASNVLMGVMMTAPVLESFAVQGLRDSHWDAQWQTQVINLESFTFTALVSSVMKNLIARERPFVRNCANGRCEGTEENRSMPSNHAALAFTGAGLLCTHHKYQDYYGSETTDNAICATGLGVSAVDGILRIISDRHYTTDVLAGTAIGLFSGFILPRLLHYPWHNDRGEKKSDAEDSLLKHLSFAPAIYSEGGGLTCALRF